MDNDGEFLFKGRENCLIRIPSLEKKTISIQKISPPVKVLVIISNPPDLPEELKLDVVIEKRLIKEALRPLIDEGKLAVKWIDEASLERIQDLLLEFNPHIIHYTGHGAFDEEKGGMLLISLFSAPILLWFIILGCATLVLTTKTYKVHPDEPEDAKRVFEEIASAKQRWLMRGLYILMVSFVVLFVDIYIFLGAR